MATGNRLVGVIGGMGPDATVDFMAKVIEKTPAGSDQDHVRMLVEHNPRIPSRQAAMRGDGENPGPVIAELASRLEANGADYLFLEHAKIELFPWREAFSDPAGLPPDPLAGLVLVDRRRTESGRRLELYRIRR